jgi:hypothetical protein
MVQSWMPTSPLDPHHPRTKVTRPPAASLDTIAADPVTATTLPAETVTALLTQLTIVQSALMARLLAVAGTSSAPTLDTADSDRLLTAHEAAVKLSVSKDWLYRHASTLPFTVRPTRGRTLRFSLQGLDSYIRRRTGGSS